MVGAQETFADWAEAFEQHSTSLADTSVKSLTSAGSRSPMPILPWATQDSEGDTHGDTRVWSQVLSFPTHCASEEDGTVLPAF